MEKNLATPLADDPLSAQLIGVLEAQEAKLQLEDAVLYYNYPLYRADEGDPVAARVLILSPHHGVLLLECCEAATADGADGALKESDDKLASTFSFLFSRLIKNKALRKSKQELRFPVQSVVFAPRIAVPPAEDELENDVVTSEHGLAQFVGELENVDISPDVFTELTSTAEGAKALARPKTREIPSDQPHSRGRLASLIEAEITTFDQQQKSGALIEFQGPQRIRGLAGSGKTVVLAMKAALLHLRQPEASILYTFYTKSLYGHIQRLITRFYRQFDDRDPDWSRLRIRHAWGGPSTPGVYYEACIANGVPFLSYTQASERAVGDPFDYACLDLLRRAAAKPSYDYVLIDEGQDYPASFVRLCRQLAVEDRFVVAYDELQTIFQATAPTAASLFGVKSDGEPEVEFQSDIILRKCYRNPREILTVAHALGFGVYGKRIVQMLENREHWEDIGYEVVEGEFNPGGRVVVERSGANSLRSISSACAIGQIISWSVCDSPAAEIELVVEGVQRDLAEGLRPDDIAVVCVDDKSVATYMDGTARALRQAGIPASNLQGGRYAPTDFMNEGSITLCTVHRAKGNEAFSVYVLGVDALFLDARVRQRNMLFTAMTRAKGWVHLSGTGDAAKTFAQEIKTAVSNFPRIEFTYPTAEQLLVMKRDLEATSKRRIKAERFLDAALSEIGPEELERILKKRGSRGAKKEKPNRK